MKFFGFVLAASVALVACNNEAAEPSDADTVRLDSSTTASDSAISPQPYFPVSSFLKGEIQYVDSLPVGIMKYRTIGSRVDSSYIKSDEFHRLAAEFLPPTIDDSAFSKNFTESSFMDRSSNTATFFYKAIDPRQPVQRIDVVTAKGDIYDEVKSLYIEKTEETNGQPVSKRLFWKPKRNFQIITINSQGSAASAKSEVVKVVWDNRE